MTKLQIMKENQQKYAEQLVKISIMEDGLEKAVAENLILVWIKGNKWMGGISDSKYQKISDRLVADGYDETDIYDEFNKQAEECYK